MITLKSGEVITDELAVADAHPLGARPFAREQYIAKFTELAEGVVEPAEQQRFLPTVRRACRPEGRCAGRAQRARRPARCWTRRRRSRRGSSDERRPDRARSSSAAEKRAAFRAGLDSGRLQRFPGAFSPLVAKLVAEIGFEGVYVSGAVLSADLGLPDIGLTTLTEVAARGAQIAGVTDLPTLIDADTGFGEPMSAARTVTILEDAGLAGCHIEDQVNPKRCGHLDGKAVVPDRGDGQAPARRGRRPPRPELRHLRPHRRRRRSKAWPRRSTGEGLRRRRRRHDLPRGAAAPAEFEKFRAAVDMPLLANMTEFGKSELLTAAPAVRHRLQHRDLPGHDAAAGDGRRRGRAARDRFGRHASRPARSDAAPQRTLRTAALRRLQRVRLRHLQLRPGGD